MWIYTVSLGYSDTRTEQPIMAARLYNKQTPFKVDYNYASDYIYTN